uniref:TldD/PmbA family protein n=1 Tax=candidate division WOR-3 bacterium TaxID=2052148 RepID=A0A7C4CAH0_UNCW3
MTREVDKVTSAVEAGLDRMLESGCSFADARFYSEDRTRRITIYDGNLEGNSSNLEQGIGIRVLFQGAVGFAATANLDAVSACFDRALDNARAAARLLGFPRDMGKAQPAHGEYSPPVRQDPFDIPLTEHIALLKQIDDRLKHPAVAHRYVTSLYQRRRVFYWNTEGTGVSRVSSNIFATMTVMAPDKDGRTQRRSHNLNSNGSGSRGFEWLADPNSFAGHAERIRQELAEIIAAEPMTPAKRDVILLPGQGHLQVHETIGHPLELDRILGYELSFAGGSHVRPSDIGTLRYGSDKLNARAMLVENSPGTFGFDDEGTPQPDYLLIDKGILVNVLCSRIDLGEANAKAGREVVKRSGGAARAAGFYKTPIDRMTNVCIDPGADGNLDDIIKATENGVILDMPVSWSIGSNREHFHFGCEIAWEVKDGRRTRVLRNPTYQGHTLEFYNSLDMVGDRSTWRLIQVPNCGKGEPNQIMEVGHGVPVMRFRNVQTGEKE